MDGAAHQQHIEDITKYVYGETFARYDSSAFLAFLRPLEVRLAKNGISHDVFRGKRCLDAGCGSGRGTVLMARAGAAHVVAFDFADKNLETTRTHCRRFGLTNVTTEQGSLLDIPFENDAFDIVWCNGVLHHTVDPDRALREVARVLHPGGHLWLYLYGSGGIYWFMVDFMREWLRDIGPEACLDELLAMGVPIGRTAEFIDDWFVPTLRRYIRPDVSRRLAELGFGKRRYLKHGMSYDTCQRRGDDRENRWMGGGDVRYWATKTAQPNGCAFPLPNADGKGSVFLDHGDVLSFTTDLARLAEAAAAHAPDDPALFRTVRIRAAAALQTRLRDQFTESTPFDAVAFRRFIHEQIAALPPSLFSVAG